MIEYKMDVVQALKDKGYTTYKIRKEHLISESSMTKIRKNDPKIDLNTIDKLCNLLKCQPGSIIRYIPDDVEE